MLWFSRNRLFLVALTALFIFAVFFAGAFVFLHFNHDHTGEDCPVCLQIQNAQNLSRGLAPAPAFFSWPEGRAKTTERLSVFSGLFSPDPVSLKVRFNS
jgi:hypothetical protein